MTDQQVKKPYVSVIVVTHDSERILERCLNAIFRQDYQRFEVIIIDAKSTDQTIGIARRYPAKVIPLNRNILGYSRQVGIDNAGGDICAFIDTDMILPTDTWLKETVNLLFREKLKDERIVGTWTRWKYDRHAPRIVRYTQLYTYFLQLRDARMREPPKIITKEKSFGLGLGNNLVLKSAIKEVGGFNTQLHWFDDADLVKRILDRGYAFVAAKGLDVWHYHALNFTHLIKKSYYLYCWGAMQSGGELDMKNALLSVPWSMYCALQQLRRDRDPVWLVHPVMQVARTFFRTYAALKYRRAVKATVSARTER